MRRVFRWIGMAVAMVVALVLLGVAVVGVVSWRRINRVHTVDVVVPRSIPADAAAIERGRHLATAVASCSLCHGPDLGGQMLQQPSAFGTLAAPNLTRGADELSRYSLFRGHESHRGARH